MRLPASLRRHLRAWQTRFPILQDAKPDAQRRINQLLKRPFDRDFQVLRYLAPEQGECFVDIGANRGQSIDAIRLYHPRQPVVAFEPNSLLAARLRRRFARDAGVAIHDVGLSDIDHEAPLHVPFYRGWMFDGLASFDREAAATWLDSGRLPGFDPGLLRIETVRCVLRQLDSFDLNPVFIKIDVQGFEAQVLRGGEKTLVRCHPLLMIEDGAHLVGWLETRGFAAYAFNGSTLQPLSTPRQNIFFVAPSMRDRLERGGLVFNAA